MKNITHKIATKQTPQPDKWDTFKADAGEQESKRTEIWPHDYQPPADIEMITDVIYGQPGGRKLDLDVLMHRSLPPKPRPAIVFLHGGSWIAGDKHQFHRQAAMLAYRYDVVGVCVNYRLSGEATFPAALQDSKCAVRWVRSVAQQYNIDPTRIGVCGGSAGAHLSAMMAVSNGGKAYEGDGGHDDCSSDVNLAILFNGEFDMQDLLAKKSLLGAMEKFFGGTPEQIPQIYRECSPILRVHKDCPPMLFLHGTVDTCVSHEQSLAMAKRLTELGVPAEVELYKGKPHAWFNGEPHTTLTMERVGKFLEQQWKLVPAKN